MKLARKSRFALVAAVVCLALISGSVYANARSAEPAAQTGLATRPDPAGKLSARAQQIAQRKAETSSAQTEMNSAATQPPAGTRFGPVWVVFYHSWKCLDNPGPSTANVWLDQYQCIVGATNLQWYFEWTTDGYVRIINRYSGKCLNVENGSTANGARVIQYPCGPASRPHYNEQWIGPRLLFKHQIDDVVFDFRQLVARHSGLCLNVQGGSEANNAKMIQWNCGADSWYPNSYVTWF